MSFPAFYPIFDDVSWVKRLVPLGIKAVQLRIKDRSVEDLRRQITEARDFCAGHGTILVVNDYWQLAIELRCEWLHLGQEDLDAADLDEIRGAGLKLGISTHDNAELDRALALWPDYVALGPIYPTITKEMKWRRQGPGKLTEWKAKVGNIPLVAIGGMSVERAAAAFAAGADAISAITDITLHSSPENRVRAWLDTCA